MKTWKWAINCKPEEYEVVGQYVRGGWSEIGIKKGEPFVVEEEDYALVGVYVYTSSPSSQGWGYRLGSFIDGYRWPNS
jgi:hypothetical protein